MAKSVLSRRALVIRSTAVVLAAVVLVVAAARTGKWLVVQRLAARVRTSDDAMAGRLVGELAAFGKTAYPALLAAANSERSAVALAARAEVDHMVDEWQQQAFLHPATFSIEARALPLAQAIETQLPGATVSGRRWARRVLMELVELAQSQNIQQRVALVRTCDRALSALPTNDPPLAFQPDVDYRLTLAPPETPILPEDAFVSEPRSADLVLPPAEPTTEPVASEPPPTDSRELIVLEAIPLQPKAVDEAPLQQWNDDWAQARLRELRESSTSRVPAHSASTQRQGDSSGEMDTETESVDDQLFAALAQGDEQTQAGAADELEKRGYGLVTHRDARMATSASIADRAALVNLALTSPRLEPTAWLWRLAHDPAAEVRSAAMSGIVTSSDRQLIAEALDLALRDTDPRVAGYAEMLKKRLK